MIRRGMQALLATVLFAATANAVPLPHRTPAPPAASSASPLAGTPGIRDVAQRDNRRTERHAQEIHAERLHREQLNRQDTNRRNSQAAARGEEIRRQDEVR